MMITAQGLLGISLAIPFITAVLTALLAHRRNICDSISLVAPFLTLLSASALIFTEPQWIDTTLDLDISVASIPIAFHLEPMGVMFAMLVCLLWPTSMIYTIVYLQNTQDKSKFLVYYNLSVGSALCIATASNFLTLFIFYEVLTLCTYPLVTHTKTQEAMAAGRFYLLSLLGTSMIFLLVVVVSVWYLAGTLDFVKGGILNNVNVELWVISLLFILTVFGSAKSAIMPLHKWLPKAMVAPVPVSALLHAVAVVKAGVFTIAKVTVYIFGTDILVQAQVQWLMYLAGATIIIASLIALRQTNLKKLLAYSTVSQLSYVILGVALLNPFALIASILHILAHGFAKITLFFAVGAIQTASGKTQTNQLSGIGRQMPLTMIGFTIAALSIIGLPPLIGFVSKWFLLTGASITEQYFVTIVIVLSTVLNAMYFLPIIYHAFFAQSNPNDQYKEVSAGMLVGILWPASMCLILFFYANDIIRFLAERL